MELNRKKNKLCPIHEASKVIGDTWNILIIRALLSGKRRFCEIEESIEAITSSALSDRLKKLQDAGLITRKQYVCIPPKVEYSLTKEGKSLKVLISEIEKFAEKRKHLQ